MTNSGGRVWTGVFRFAPSSGDHRVAVRAALTIGVAMLFLWWIGRLDLSVYASFGAFSALYGRGDVFSDRIRMQASAGGILVLAMLAGTALSFTNALALVAVVTVSLIAALVTLLAYAMRWHPPGPLFIVFAAGATASIPASEETFVSVLAVGSGGAILALAITTLFAAVSSRGSLRLEKPRKRVPIGNVAWEMSVTVGIATLLGGALGFLLVGTHWYWAMVGAAAAVSGSDVTARLIRGLQRLGGTLIGVLLAAGLLSLHLQPLAVIAVTIILQGAAEMFVGRNYGIAMIFITPLALLVVQLASPTSIDVLLFDRTLETVIGVAAGTLVALVSAALRRRPTARE